MFRISINKIKKWIGYPCSKPLKPTAMNLVKIIVNMQMGCYSWEINFFGSGELISSQFKHKIYRAFGRVFLFVSSDSVSHEVLFFVFGFGFFFQALHTLCLRPSSCCCLLFHKCVFWILGYTVRFLGKEKHLQTPCSLPCPRVGRGGRDGGAESQGWTGA